MCIFSGDVDDVSSTKIFARYGGPSAQYLVYSMQFATERSVAMILPIPVSSRAEDAVRFIDLSGYPGFFDDMYRPFQGRGAFAAGSTDLAGAELEVHDVGDFVASFVPTLRDFDRLDEQFTLPRATWDQLPKYADYGFCVFQFILERALLRGSLTAHPMAFEFPTRHPDMLFFPTVHVHDGEVHPRDAFDHQLYFQCQRHRGAAQHTSALAADYVDIDRVRGIVAGQEVLRRRTIAGLLPNNDTWIETV
jgi:hypothetical protein